MISIEVYNVLKFNQEKNTTTNKMEIVLLHIWIYYKANLVYLNENLTTIIMNVEFKT